ncbi:MAG: YitT family protein [Lachnospiraceae bacterium]|nr:YitT family protein [Lachnospiraceae bacterium]
MKQVIKNLVIIFFAQIINTIGFSLVLIPNNLSPTGIGGFCTTIYKVFGINMQLLMLIIACPIVIWAFIKYDKNQVFYTAYSYVLFTTFTAFIGKILPEFHTDPFIAALAGGVILGFGTGLILRINVSNSPEAIVSNYLREYYGITPGSFFLVLNSIVIFSSISYGNITLIIYSLFSNYICSVVTDKVVLGVEKYYEVNIITSEIFKITDFIRKELGRSVVYVQCMDTENVSKKMMIKTVITNQQLTSLKLHIEKTDDDSFVYVSESAGLIGTSLEASVNFTEKESAKKKKVKGKKEPKLAS